MSMKTQFTTKILPALAGIALALFVSFSFAPQIRAQVGNFFGTEGGNYGAQRFQLTAKNNDTIDFVDNTLFDIDTSSHENAIFRMAGTALFDNVMSFGQTRLEKLVIGSQLLGANAFDPLAGYALDVNGSIAVRKFSNDQNKSHYLCADDFGKLVIKDNANCGNTVNGQCSPKHYGCDAGLSTNNNETQSEYTWTCLGANGGTDANCTEVRPINGQCGKGLYECGRGTLSNKDENAEEYTWTCLGSNGGTNANCSEKKVPVNGQCSPKHYGCDAGTSVNDISDTTTQYRWHCNGKNGGTNATCSEAKPINGVCSSTHYGCDAGTSVNDISDTTTQYRWHCNGINGGTNATCSEENIGLPSCFIAGTKVTMADGSEKNIEEVKLGEFVLGNNGEVSEVKGLHRPLLGEGRSTKLYSFNGGPYFVNSDHPFLTTEGWKAMDPIEAEKVHRMFKVTQLHVGDTLITKDGLVLLEQIDEKEGDPSTQLYNLMLGGNHTYIADGYIVHNKK